MRGRGADSPGHLISLNEPLSHTVANHDFKTILSMDVLRFDF